MRKTFALSDTVLIDILCPYGRISYGVNTLEKVYIHKKEKCSRLAQPIRNAREMHLEIIPILILS
jgi:hypothetical protein